MRHEDARRLLPIAGLVALVGLSACASHKSPPPPPPPPAAEAQPTEPTLVAEEYVEGDALVQAVNRSTRTVTLRSDDQKVTTVQVPADVDLNRVKAGDRVRLGVYQSISARVLPAGSAPLGATVAAGSTAPGQPEGRAWAQQVVVVAEITQIDLTNHTVTVTGAEGKVHTIAVKDPEMQQRMANLQVGDLLELTYADVIAAKVMPRK